MRSRILAFLTALLMLFTLLPLSVLAADEGYTGRTLERTNPLLPPVSDTEAQVYAAAPTAEAPVFETDPAVVSAALRDAMELRSAAITVYYRTDHHLEDAELDTLFYAAFEETGVPTQGDYLRLSWQRYRINIDCQISDGGYDHTLTYYVTYETTAEQEVELAEAIELVIAGFGFTDESTEYDRIRTIYDYICSSIVYDYENLYDSSYRLKYTAYAAMIHKTAVCEGYAELFYRMALHAGLSARIITGRSFGDNHAWNIVRIGKLYYNVDSTWDAGSDVYDYFLMGSTDFLDHTREQQFSSASFNARYPTAPTAYQHIDCTEHSPVTDAALAPTCESDGLTEGSHCGVCQATLTAQTTVPALGHDYADGKCTRCEAADPNYNPFTDVSDSDYFRVPVLWAVYHGITTGTAPDTFSPDTVCTRAQAVTFLWRAAGSPASTLTACPFTDVDEDAYYRDAVLWAVEQGITGGVAADRFGPDEPCTRAQIVTFLWRAQGSPAPAEGNDPFTDVSEDSYFYAAVLWAAAEGITSGTTPDTFSPDAPCTRGQIVTFLYQTAK